MGLFEAREFTDRFVTLPAAIDDDIEVALFICYGGVTREGGYESGVEYMRL